MRWGPSASVGSEVDERGKWTNCSKALARCRRGSCRYCAGPARRPRREKNWTGGVTSLENDFSARLAAAGTDVPLRKKIEAQIAQAAFDRTLIIYLAVAGLVVAVGSVLRAVSHSSETTCGKTTDFVGKCLALTGAVLGGSGAVARFEQGGFTGKLGPMSYTAAGAAFLLVFLLISIFGWLAMKSAKAAKDAKAATASKAAAVSAKAAEAASAKKMARAFQKKLLAGFVLTAVISGLLSRRPAKT